MQIVPMTGRGLFDFFFLDYFKNQTELKQINKQTNKDIKP